MTDPLILPDVDLRGLDYMPLFGNHLFGSEFNAAASDSEWRAALTLWWAAWNQVPAGSLPNDDIALCRLADLGRDVKTWRKLRTRALHGFTLCSDGRLYHSFICEQAKVAWEKRVKERDRKAKWRAEQDAKKAGRDADVPGTKSGTDGGTEQGQDATVRADGKGKDGTGRDGKEEQERAEAVRARLEAEGHTPTQAGLACRAMRDAGMADVNPGDPRLLALLEQGATAEELASVAAEGVKRQRGFAWALAALVGRRADAAAIALAPRVEDKAGAEAAAQSVAYLAEQAAAAAAARTPEAQAARRAAMAKVGRAAA